MSLLILRGMATECVQWRGSQASGKVGKGHWEQLKQLERELKCCPWQSRGFLKNSKRSQLRDVGFNCAIQGLENKEDTFKHDAQHDLQPEK